MLTLASGTVLAPRFGRRAAVTPLLCKQLGIHLGMMKSAGELHAHNIPIEFSSGLACDGAITLEVFF